MIDERGAEISPCGAYRYRLWRYWSEAKARCTFVMLNPSTANETEDDPTIRRCIGFAQRRGYGGMEIVNLFALRATDPKMLMKHGAPSGGDRNDEAILSVVQKSDLTIVAWGEFGRLFNRAWTVRKLLKDYKLYALRVNASGQPAHPLYLPKNLTPVLWNRA